MATSFGPPVRATRSKHVARVISTPVTIGFHVAGPQRLCVTRNRSISHGIGSRDVRVDVRGWAQEGLDDLGSMKLAVYPLFVLELPWVIAQDIPGATGPRTWLTTGPGKVQVFEKRVLFDERQ